LGITTHVRRVSPRLWFFCKFLRFKYLRGESEIVALRDFVPRQGKMAIDAGAAIGLYSRALADLVPKVVAFEANPAVAAFARTVASRKVEVINVALSSAAKRTTLRIPLNRRGHTINDLATIECRNDFAEGEFVTADVVTETLDAFAFADCGFIKIDVEGHEEEVLEGAKKLIERSRPVLMIELEERHNPGTFERVTQRLSRQGYAGYFLAGGKWRPIAEFLQQRDQDWSAVLKAPPRPRRRAHYICNFVFAPLEAIPAALRGGEVAASRREITS
jgi:FkbM family methyltransferase